MQLQLIDMDAPVAEQAAIMAVSCEKDGFFRIPSSVIDRAVADAAWNAAADFFALPEAEKRRVEFPTPGYPYGYSPFKFESLAKSTDDPTSDAVRLESAPDLKESLSVGPDCALSVSKGATPPDQGRIRSPSLWPRQPAGLRPAWEAYYRALADVAARLMSVMAVALDLTPDYFDSLIDNPITSMRALHYPALDVGAIENIGSLRAGAHSDYGTLTILRTDNVAGLEIRQSDGSWVAVDPEPNTFVVNLGDSIAQWTNDRWRSTVHRVALTDTAARQSFAFFHMANWDAVIECLPTCLDPGEQPRHQPVQAGPWLMRKFTSTVT